ncbi:MAG: hypothetical protein JW982_12815 [Spirochaetes bacterium]|nr:hypothetical protein [Spirochaetota bacterium]
MSLKMPVIRQAALISIIPQLLLLTLLIYAASFAISDIINRTIAAVMVFYVILISLRHIAWHHRKGIKQYKKRDFAAAIPFFMKSYDFFKKHSWLDKYRYIFLLSSSRLTYREMALLNAAFCFSQINQGKQAREHYEQVLQEFPESQLAKTALNMMDAAKNTD